MLQPINTITAEHAEREDTQKEMLCGLPSSAVYVVYVV